MASLLCLLLAFSLVLAAALPAVTPGAIGEQTSSLSPLGIRTPFSTDSPDLAGDVDEVALDSESSRRVVAGTAGKYIQYGHLHAGTIPCSIPGHSYYNCREGAEINPYTRPYDTINKCRSPRS